MENKPLFEMFKEKKMRLLCRDDDFFKKTNQDRETYFNNEFLNKYFDAMQFTKEEKKKIQPKIIAIHILQCFGFLDMQWDTFFKIRKKESVQEVIDGRYAYLVRMIPELETNFDQFLKAYNDLYKQPTNVLKNEI